MLTDNTQSSVLVTGATNQIGRFLLPRLQAANFVVTACSRQPQPNTSGITWFQTDLLTLSLPSNQHSQLFHIAPLPLLPSLVARLPSLTRVIAFSSTSCFSKANSPDPKERAIANQLSEAETASIAACQSRNIVLTIFRPTLIYGCGMDKNVTFIAKFIQRFGFFPLVGKGSGLRQPVHADDLAVACLQACSSPTTANKTYNLGGGQTLSYREMVTIIFQHLGKKPHIIEVKLTLFNLLARSLVWLPAFSHLSTAMIARMNQDLCFDHSKAYRDFGYQPRGFMMTDK